MMDQQNLEPVRPASADPAVALAELLGQLPKPATEKPKAVVAKSTVAELAQELGLKLGDQNDLTIRRIKRGKSYSFVRTNRTRSKHVGTIRPGRYFASPGGRHPSRDSAAIPPSSRSAQGQRPAHGAPAGKTGRRTA